MPNVQITALLFGHSDKTATLKHGLIFDNNQCSCSIGDICDLLRILMLVNTCCVWYCNYTFAVLDCSCVYVVRQCVQLHNCAQSIVDALWIIFRLTGQCDWIVRPTRQSFKHRLPTSVCVFKIMLNMFVIL